MFMHGGLLHLGGNMLFLWIFGNNVEDTHGPGQVPRLLPARRARGDARCRSLVDPNSAVPNLGASGAIAAVLGGYLLLFPRARVVTRDLHHLLLHDPRAAGAARSSASGSPQQALFGYFGLAQRGGRRAAASRTSRTSAASLFGLLAIKLFASERRRQRQIERAG